MKIKEFAAQTGLSPATLRFYEKEGLLLPQRDANGYRAYSEQDIDWALCILRLKQMGVPLTQMKTYAHLKHQGNATVSQRYALLQAHREALTAQQQELAAYQYYLEQKLAVYRAFLEEGGEAAV
ncbi:MerR family transcriptional regulator [Neisseria chenwenguii]|uniref:MerR family transcriptional regulator n=1 Tax=Neisseria chenwenguii TaxID=1853278 RepID=A0A220S0W0_9NEIS|nr:MerR family transcriptional regulator [Neisseria chenwenguii]ASK27018.1 MerR family transcriptional regulator [Neisseria chenwenguii]ROV56081.1 MerR family transcriptional regulator [Neisseria chenwenguii]